jgi:hypothetical protein
MSRIGKSMQTESRFEDAMGWGGEGVWSLSFEKCFGIITIQLELGNVCTAQQYTKNH